MKSEDATTYSQLNLFTLLCNLYNIHVLLVVWCVCGCCCRIMRMLIINFLPIWFRLCDATSIPPQSQFSTVATVWFTKSYMAFLIENINFVIYSLQYTPNKINVFYKKRSIIFSRFKNSLRMQNTIHDIKNNGQRTQEVSIVILKC